jgi:hypothetical protein
LVASKIFLDSRFRPKKGAFLLLWLGAVIYRELEDIYQKKDLSDG